MKSYRVAKRRPQVLSTWRQADGSTVSRVASRKLEPVAPATSMFRPGSNHFVVHSSAGRESSPDLVLGPQSSVDQRSEPGFFLQQPLRSQQSTTVHKCQLPFVPVLEAARLIIAAMLGVTGIRYLAARLQQSFVLELCA